MKTSFAWALPVMALALAFTGCKSNDVELNPVQPGTNGPGDPYAIELTAAADMPAYIDLGLPSGTLWATRNVGAATPGDAGYCVAWGDINPSVDRAAKVWKEVTELNGTKHKELRDTVYKAYTWETYKWAAKDDQIVSGTAKIIKDATKPLFKEKYEKDGKTLNHTTGWQSLTKYVGEANAWFEVNEVVEDSLWMGKTQDGKADSVWAKKDVKVLVYVKTWNDDKDAEGNAIPDYNILKPEDDAATQHMGANYHTPTPADFEELRNECFWRMAKMKVAQDKHHPEGWAYGYQVSSKKDENIWIFLPAPGCVKGGTEFGADEDGTLRDGCYWTNEAVKGGCFAKRFTLGAGAWHSNSNSFRPDDDRANGHFVRAVYRP